MKIEDEVAISEARIELTRTNIAIREVRVTNEDESLENVKGAKELLEKLEIVLEMYVEFHRKLLRTAVIQGVYGDFIAENARAGCSTLH